MAENTFKSPGFFEREIELTAEKQSPIGTPAGVIGSSLMGPAFVPLTIGTFTDFENRFGTVSPEKPATYAVREWLKNRTALTFMRTLGAGANATPADFGITRQWGTVKNAGFKVVGDSDTGKGFVQFLYADHVVSANSDVGFPIYTDNDTVSLSLRENPPTNDSPVKIVRGMIICAEDAKFELKNFSGVYGASGMVSEDNGSNTFVMKLTKGESTKELTVSLDPDHTYYLGKVLNTDAKKFQSEGYVLYLDLGVEQELAPAMTAANANHVFISHGKSDVDASNNESFASAFGRFDTRYKAPKTTSFISQPFGKIEYDLFHFECLSDGAYANTEFKISIANLRKSSDPNDKYGTFDVLVRKFNDTDFAPQVLERFINCTLNPNSDSFIARKIGDKKVVFAFDADLEEERRLVISGRYPNRSLNIRVVMNDSVYKGEVPQEAVPFGFRGIPVLDISENLAAGAANYNFPAMPLTFKATKGQVKYSNLSYVGEPGNNERADKRIYFGVKTTRIVDDSEVADGVLESNLSGEMSPVVKAYTKFMGVKGGSSEIGHFVSDADSFNNNKFTLARIALNTNSAANFDSLSSVNAMREACYIRNGNPDASDYSVTDSLSQAKRMTFASLIHDDTANNFNKFSNFAKFTNIFYGGFDGLNILDGDIQHMNDRAASSETSNSLDSTGKASDSFTGGLGLSGTDDGTMMGKGKDNNIISSYRQAIKIMTDPMTTKINLLAIPGIRDPYITDFAANMVRDYSLAMFLMDIPAFDKDQKRIFSSGRPDIEYTGNALEARALNNNYVATYFPDVFITDPINNRRVLVPASVAAIGALGYNDAVAYPWFAPAGFNRGGLDFVENVKTRLSSSDRDDLYERKINPIANFPNGGFVIFGQKTMQINESALDRVNVRRLMLEVKRQVVEVASTILFEQNNKATRDRLVGLISPKLSTIQAQSGVERFKVICDETNNSQTDADEYKLNGKIIIVPTKTIEFIAIDFIVTNSGVSFG